MSRGINKAIIVGNVGNDPEIKYMPSGKAVANFSIATSETWKDKQTGEQKEKTEWHRCNAFDKLAEIIGEYVKKGSKIYIEGSIHTRKWQDQSGQDRYSTEIRVKEMQMLDSRNTEAGNAGYGQPQPPQPQAAPPSQPGTDTGGGFNDFDDSEIPF